jgi:hypothetical protein
MTSDRRETSQNDARPQDAGTTTVAPVRKTFVEPTISSPVDVLEATTFFQTVDSGGTGVRRKD